MDDRGPQHPLSDSQLDRELESAISVEPSPEFLARVRTRIAAEPEESLWPLAMWRRGLQPGMVMALAAVVLAVVVLNVMRTGAPSEQRLAVGRQVDVPARETVEHFPPRARDEGIASVARQGKADVQVDLSKEADAVHTVPLRLSQPLFSEDERRAIFQFAVAVGEGRMPPVAVDTEAHDQSGAIDRLIIQALMIDPLPQLAQVEKQGEGQW